ncbi:MAG: hypothetical protein HC897_18530 [Thermoanaerobaculia bacterium]|nr:hypothetical protein [Thermoanaerobaculia bacterium]
MADPEGEPLVEGVAGSGDDFMIGQQAPEALPEEVVAAVSSLYSRARELLGPVRLEWVHDGRQPWVLQLHRGATETVGRVIYPGEASRYRRFEVSGGLEALRASIAEVAATGEGIVLVGQVGVTSHFGDVLRKAQIPSRLEEPG